MRPYVTNPCILSKDTVADLALLVKLQPHYIPYGLFMFSSELECCTRNSSKIDTVYEDLRAHFTVVVYMYTKVSKQNSRLFKFNI